MEVTAIMPELRELELENGSTDRDNLPNNYVENALNRARFRVDAGTEVVVTSDGNYQFYYNDWVNDARITTDKEFWVCIKKIDNSHVKASEIEQYIHIARKEERIYIPETLDNGLTDITGNLKFENKAFYINGGVVSIAKSDNRIAAIFKPEKKSSLMFKTLDGYKGYILECKNNAGQYTLSNKYQSGHAFNEWFAKDKVYYNVYPNREYLICYGNKDDKPISSKDYMDILRIYTVDNTVHIPEYYKEHIREKVKDVNAKQAKADTFSFAFITDIHLQHNTKHSPALLKELQNKCAIKTILGGGDFVTAWLADADGKDGLIDDFYEIRELYAQTPLAKTPGNHEWAYGGSNQYNISPYEMYNYFMQDCEQGYDLHYGEDKTYYYIDDTVNKMRYITVNIADYANTTQPGNDNKVWKFVVSATQISWLKNILNSIPDNEWTCVILSHIVPLKLSEFSGFTGAGTDIENCKELQALATAYKNKTGDFANAKGSLVCWLGGHMHNDDITQIGGINYITSNADCLKQETGAPAREIDSVTEQSFDVFTVDKRNKSVLITKIGAGSNRKFNY